MKRNLSIEGSVLPFDLKKWDETHGVSLCFITLNEQKNIESFLNYHKDYVRNIVMVDGGSSDDTLNCASKIINDIKIVKFKGHFGNQKNRAIEMSKNDWILLLDPDEKASEGLLKSLPDLINQDEFDCYAFPRRNFIDNAPDDSHGDDYQFRLFRSYCRFVRPVHEELVGYKKVKLIEPSSDNYILHSKDSERHIERNMNYMAMELIHSIELGCPGCQTEDTFQKKFPNIYKVTI